jgi:hypothetical protein
MARVHEGIMHGTGPTRQGRSPRPYRGCIPRDDLEARGPDHQVRPFFVPTAGSFGLLSGVVIP